MAFHLDRRNRLSYSAQVERQALAHLVAGRLHPGDRLPSVRRLARDLHISRTTAERIQNVLCDVLLAQVRPRSGAFVAPPANAPRAQALYEFVRRTLFEARQLGLDAARLGQLAAAVENQSCGRASPSACFPILSTLDAFDCLIHCLGNGFPAKLVHLPPSANATHFPRGAKYLLSGYSLRARARRIAEEITCPLIYVRYNVELLDRSMAIPEGDFRYVVTRDPDNAETTRIFLASAYPEVSPTRYAVMAAADWQRAVRTEDRGGMVWATITAVPAVEETVPVERIEALHPLVADDFVEELRCLAAVG